MPLADFTRDQIAALSLVPGDPLLLVDADEVLVNFIDHFTAFAPSRGFTLQMTEYSFEGALRDQTGRPATQEEGRDLLHGFFAEECLKMQAIDGAAAGLSALAATWRVVVLTNAPAAARDDRASNLTSLGMPYPVVANEGGKGHAMALMAEVAGPIAIIDDTPKQIAHVAKHCPRAMTVHFVGPDTLRRIMPPVPEADLLADDWNEIAAALADPNAIRA